MHAASQKADKLEMNASRTAGMEEHLSFIIFVYIFPLLKISIMVMLN